MKGFFISVLFIFTSVTSYSQVEWKQRAILTLDSICHIPYFEETQVGIYIHDLTEGEEFFSFNGRQRMRPASIQKVVTSVAALTFLGSDYNFRTDLCVSGEVRNRTLNGDVYVVGGMDPLLTKSDMNALNASLVNSGIDRITGKTYADVSMKDDLEYGWGWCWDDDYGPYSALMVDGKPSTLPSSVKAVTKRVIGSVTHSIQEVMMPMMKESNNIYAECLFYQMGKDRKQVAKRIDTFLSSLTDGESHHRIADGSGLSLYNYTTPELMVKVLNYAYLNDPIREAFFPTLPNAGVDGTLKKRMTETRAANNVRAKTGTVDGVSSLCGYLISGHGHLLSFCIINQGSPSAKEAKEFQDKVCVMLCNP